MNRIANLLASATSIPTSADSEWANYNISEQRLLYKSGGDKEKLLRLYRRVTKRSGAAAGRLGALEVNLVTGYNPVLSQTLNSDLLRANGQYGLGLALLGNEMFVGEPGAIGSIFVVGEVHYYTRADGNSDWERQSGFFANTQSSGQLFGSAVAYDGTNVAVGSPNPGAGDVWVYQNKGASFDQQILPSAAGSGDKFGQALDIVGDHLLIGAPEAESSGVSRGLVEYWENVAGTWTFRSSFISNQTPTNAQRFGQGVAMVDDSTAYVAVHKVGDLTGTTTIEKWTRSGTTWSYDSGWDVDYGSDSAQYMQLGTDGTNLIVGVYQNHTVTSDEGKVLVMSQAGEILTEIDGTELDSQLGRGVAIDGNDVVLGLAFADPSATSAAGRIEHWSLGGT